MKIEIFSLAAQEGLRLWAKTIHGDELLFDANASSPEVWSWAYFQLSESEDRAEWFPRGKWATLQLLEGKLREEARDVLGAGLSFERKENQ